MNGRTDRLMLWLSMHIPAEEGIHIETVDVVRIPGGLALRRR